MRAAALSRRALALALVVFALLSHPAAAQVQAQAIRSPGGVEAWLVSDSTVPMIVLQAYWEGGSASEPEDAVGITGVMTDMLTEGAGDLDANAFKERLQDLNMSLGFSSGWDGVGMSLVTLTENRDAAFEMARLALMAPRFDAAPLDRIKRQILIGLRTRESNPGYLANLALDQALIPDHPYARRINAPNVAAITPTALAARRTEVFTRAGLKLTIVGDIDAETAGRLIDHAFGALPLTRSAAEPPMAQIRDAVPLIVRSLPQPQSLVLFAAPGIQDEDADWTALVVANYIIGGGGFSSRLMDEVREERGLVYGISTAPSVREHSAFIRGSAQTENADVRQAIEIIRAELARFHEEGATQAEVDDAITYLTGSFALDLDSNSKIANVVHGYHTSGRDIDYVNGRNDRIRAVTLDDVNRVARRLFDPNAFTFVVVGQPEGLDTPRP